MSALNREGLRGKKPRRETLTLPDGDTVVVQGLTGKGRDQLEKGMALDEQGKPTQKLRRAYLAALGLIDEATGALIYDAENPADLEELESADGALLEAVAAALMRLSGMTKPAQEELRKNSAGEAAGS